MLDVAEAWSNNWAWSLPLIVFTVLAHAFGLALIRDQLVLPLTLTFGRHRSSFVLAVVIAPTVMLVAVLHGIEAGAWASRMSGLGRGRISPPPCSIR
jgi:hypothetical protein